MIQYFFLRMGCASSDQKHRKDSKGHEHNNSSNSNKFHVSIADFSIFLMTS